MIDPDEQIIALMTEAVEMLPEEAETDDFEIAFGAGDFSSSLLALRQAANPFPTSLKFWMLLSKAEELLGGE